ncbi:hypothetical protein QQP08_012385, partial [Theobroma cacao]
ARIAKRILTRVSEEWGDCSEHRHRPFVIVNATSSSPNPWPPCVWVSSNLSNSENHSSLLFQK